MLLLAVDAKAARNPRTKEMADRTVTVTLAATPEESQRLVLATPFLRLVPSPSVKIPPPPVEEVPQRPALPAKIPLPPVKVLPVELAPPGGEYSPLPTKVPTWASRSRAGVTKPIPSTTTSCTEKAASRPASSRTMTAAMRADSLRELTART